jgi:serine phosphatase RsbU (regulator of sigma subunit)
MGLPNAVGLELQWAVLGDRAFAYLQVGPGLALVDAGGDLANYGLETLRRGAPAPEQVPFLEGFLPPPDTPYHLPSIELPSGRAADLHFYADSDSIWVVLLDATIEREAARRIQQRAYDMTLLQEREAQLNRELAATNEALRASQRELEASRAALQRVHERLQGELRDAAAYVRSLLPAPATGPPAADWRFVPSTELGGDAFGYHWLDPDHFAVYLLDVCGHGIGPSLMSVAVLHILQAASLRGVDFREPTQVLAALDDAYQMKGKDDLYFTLWYGVFEPKSRRLTYASAGHPPAILIGSEGSDVNLLSTRNRPIGLWPAAAYRGETTIVPARSRLYVLSDGAYEVERADGTMLTLQEVVTFLTQAPDEGQPVLDALFRFLLEQRGSEALDDDFSILQFSF